MLQQLVPRAELKKAHLSHEEMDLSYGGSGMGEEENSNSQKGKKQQHRHSTQQIQQLEAFYRDCPHPDKNQREQLSRELGLDQKQIKFWFQNKRTQIKVQNERADNNVLRTENERIHFENLAMRESLKKIICPTCDGSSGLREEENHNNLQRLRMENARLKEEHQRMMNFISKYEGNPTVLLAGMESLTNMSGKHFLGQGMAISPHDLEYMFHNTENPVSPQWLSGMQEIDKSSIIKTALAAMDELVELLRVNEPVWIKAPEDGRYMLHRETYNKLFPKSNYFTNATARFESSKDSGEVAMAAMHLIDMLLDVNKWKDMFPTIVIKANAIEVPDNGSSGGFLHLMYEKMHTLSPLVAAREFFFIRYCRQMNSSTWVMVDVSYDFINENQGAFPTRSWKLPSGCMIEDTSNGKSTVTWIEHVQVDNKSSTHRLYRDLVCDGEAYGAKKWIATLQRMCERFAFSMGLTSAPKHGPEGVLDSLERRRNLMKLSHRMVKDFCEVLSMSDKLDFSHLSEFKNSGVQVFFRKSNGPGQPDGVIFSVATSLWLPLSKENLFNFFKDEKKRVQWDILSSGNPMTTVAHISTGTHPGNSISIVQPSIESEENMMMLQESSIDPLGATMIYSLIDYPTMVSVVNGEDIMRTPILPSGYVICDDGRAHKRRRGPTSSNASNSSGSLLTVVFQILMGHSILSHELNMESIATMHSLISSTIQKIRRALDCSD